MLGYSAVVGLELNYVDSMSKYNIGLVWYYYNLWAFNWIIAFAGFFAFITLLSNIVFGLITRMIMLLAMFLVFPPLIGIAPLDEGNAFKSWRQQYMKDALMCFGAIVGMNIFFIILPFFNTIQFFEFSILNQIMNVVIMLAGLTMVKKFIGLLSGFVGGSDANSVGEETKKATAELGFKAANTTLKAGGLGFSMAKGAMRGVSGVVKTPLSMIGRGVGGIASKIAGSEKVANMKKFMSQEERDKRFVGLQKFKKAGLGFRPLTDEEQAFVDKKVKNRMSRRAARKKIGNGIDKFGKGTKSLAKRGVKRTGKIVGGLGVLSTIPFGGELKRDGDGKWDISGSLAGFGQSVVKIGKDNVKFVTDDLIGMKGGFDKVKNELYKIKAIATPMGKDGIYTQNEKGEYIHKKMFNEKQKEEAANRLSQADRQNTAASAQTSKDIKNLLEEIVKNSRRTP